MSKQDNELEHNLNEIFEGEISDEDYGFVIGPDG